MQMRKGIIYVVVAVLVLALAIVWIRHNDAKNNPNTEQVATNQTSTPETAVQPTKSPKRTSNECNVAIDTELPSNFPDDIPIYDNLAPFYSTCKSTVSAANYEVRFKTKAPVNDVIDFYKQKLAESGWTDIHARDSSYDVEDNTGPKRINGTRIFAKKDDPALDHARQLSLTVRNRRGQEGLDGWNEIIVIEIY